jgi:hypothetical protein
MDLQLFVGLWPVFSAYTQSVGLLGRVINRSQGIYAHNTDIHALDRAATVIGTFLL